MEHLIEGITAVCDKVPDPGRIVGKSQAWIEILYKEEFMKHQLFVRCLATIRVSMSMIINTLVFVNYRQTQNVLATVSWNR